MQEKILVTEDDLFLRDGLCEMLQKEGYAVERASTLKEAKAKLDNTHFQLLILDVMLPDGSGFDLCRKLRSDGTGTPILFLTACDDEIQIVRGLDCGGDDYVTKPFKLLELLSRVRALLRRGGAPVYKHGGLVIDPVHMSVKKDGKAIYVTPTEFQILAALLRCNGQTVTRGTLLQGIWDDNDIFIDDNTLSVHVSRLREKIGAGHIVTVRGVGYRWED